MPINNSHFDSLFATTTLLNDTELRALVDKCQKLIADRERIRHNKLRQELMENLQKAIEDILNNNFYLIIKNTERDDYNEIILESENTYSIEMQ